MKRIGVLRRNSVTCFDCFDGAIRLRYNYFEDLSLAIQNNYVDEKIIFDSMHNILQLHCDKFDIWVEGHKLMFPAPDLLYIETRKLRNSWRDKKYLNDQRPIL